MEPATDRPGVAHRRVTDRDERAVVLAGPNGGATPDHYVILRDGAQVAEVPGDQTSWTNAGLRPGDKFRYEVATRGGGWQSGPSPVATATTIAPSPVGLKVASTYSSATLTWKPSPLGPAPDKYVVYNGRPDGNA